MKATLVVVTTMVAWLLVDAEESFTFRQIREWQRLHAAVVEERQASPIEPTNAECQRVGRSCSTDYIARLKAAVEAEHPQMPDGGGDCRRVSSEIASLRRSIRQQERSIAQNAVACDILAEQKQGCRSITRLSEVDNWLSRPFATFSGFMLIAACSVCLLLAMYCWIVLDPSANEMAEQNADLLAREVFADAADRSVTRKVLFHLTCYHHRVLSVLPLLSLKRMELLVSATYVLVLVSFLYTLQFGALSKLFFSEAHAAEGYFHSFTVSHLASKLVGFLVGVDSNTIQSWLLVALFLSLLGAPSLWWIAQLARSLANYYESPAGEAQAQEAALREARQTLAFQHRPDASATPQREIEQ